MRSNSFSELIWCGRTDLNRHTFRYTPLKRSQRGAYNTSINFGNMNLDLGDLLISQEMKALIPSLSNSMSCKSLQSCVEGNFHPSLRVCERRGGPLQWVPLRIRYKAWLPSRNTTFLKTSGAPWINQAELGQDPLTRHSQKRHVVRARENSPLHQSQFKECISFLEIHSFY